MLLARRRTCSSHLELVAAYCSSFFSMCLERSYGRRQRWRSTSVSTCMPERSTLTTSKKPKNKEPSKLEARNIGQHQADREKEMLPFQSNHPPIKLPSMTTRCRNLSGPSIHRAIIPLLFPCLEEGCARHFSLALTFLEKQTRSALASPKLQGIQAPGGGESLFSGGDWVSLPGTWKYRYVQTTLIARANEVLTCQQFVTDPDGLAVPASPRSVIRS